MNSHRKILLLFLLVPLTIIAKANNGKENKKGDPIISGSVSDAENKKPVQGVTVSISANKGQEKKEYTTDAGGNFKVNTIPAGEVTITLEKKGYKTFRREGVLVKEGVTLKLNLELISEGADDSEVFHPLLRMMDGF